MKAISLGRSIPALAVLVCLAAGTALAADDPWLGTWKLDLAQSKLTGDTITFTKNAKGYHFSDGSSDSYDFAIDGKEYPRGHDRTVTWTEVNDHTWDSMVTGGGEPPVKIHRELSADGKTLTNTVTGTRPDGSSLNDSTVWSRQSGGSGLVGKWKDVKTNQGGPSTFVITSPAAGVYRWYYPEYKTSTEGKLDGSDLPVTGPGMAQGSTFSAKAAGPRKLTYTIKYHGKIESTGTQTVAPDGKSYTDVSWSPGKMNEKATAVYVKQ
jgi:hypothetical protein